MRIILHADDLGMNAQVNRAVFDLMAEEQLTSGSLIANGPAFSEAAASALRFPECSFGVHLNITEFAPLRPCKALEPLLDGDGNFRRSHKWFVFGDAQQKAVLQEWSAQLEHVREAGVPITHIDSHHHVHTRLGLFRCLKQLCRDHGIRRVRIRQTFAARPNVARWRIDNRLYNRKLRQEFWCTEEFGPFAAFEAFRLNPRTTVELMVHPGRRRYEAETLAFARCVDTSFRLEHQCISYRELA